jgi:hypothetical protein
MGLARKKKNLASKTTLIVDVFAITQTTPDGATG